MPRTTRSVLAAGTLPPLLHVAVFLSGIYGAYFGAGLGIINFAVLMILLPDDIQHSNALKTLLSLVVNGVAAVYFAFLGRWSGCRRL